MYYISMFVTYKRTRVLDDGIFSGYLSLGSHTDPAKTARAVLLDELLGRC